MAPPLYMEVCKEHTYIPPNLKSLYPQRDSPPPPPKQSHGLSNATAKQKRNGEGGYSEGTGHKRLQVK